MGLDMLAMVTSHKPGEPVDFEVADDTAWRFHRWWKHPNLHGWMEAVYRAKGGMREVFNSGVRLELSCGDLDRLEAAVLGDNLPTTEGFFFGESDGSELADDLAFIAEARDHLARGMTVYYTSWW